MQEENSQPLSSRSPRAELSMKHNVDRNTGMMTYQERGVHNTFRSMRNAQYDHVCSFLKFSAWCDPSLHVICMKIVSPQILMVAADLNIDKLQEQAMASHSWTWSPTISVFYLLLHLGDNFQICTRFCFYVLPDGNKSLSSYRLHDLDILCQAYITVFSSLNRDFREVNWRPVDTEVSTAYNSVIPHSHKLRIMQRLPITTIINTTITV